MHLQWVTNSDRSKAIVFREDLESSSGNVCLIGRPSADGPHSINELEAMNLVGIYMRVPFTAKHYRDFHLNDADLPNDNEGNWE